MKLFSGSANKPLTEKIAKQLSVPLSEFDIHIFPDGEKRVRVLENVVDEDCIVVQPTASPVDENYMELFFLIDSIKRSGAKSVTAVVPYLGYQRQDHVFRDGEAVSLEVIRSTLESTGLDKIIVFDLHTPKTPDIFTIDFVHLSALSLFAEEIKKSGLVNQSILISPDTGGIRRIKIISELLNNMPYASIVKNRDLISGKVTSEKIEGLDENHTYKNALIVDDMISSGSTIAVASDLLLKKGLEKVYVFVTHAVFSEEAPNILQNSNIEKVFVTDSIYIPRRKYFVKLEVISLAEIIAKELSA